MGVLETLIRPSRVVRSPGYWEGSLGYIDRLGKGRSFVLKHGILGRTRDAFVVSNVLSVVNPLRMSPRQGIGAAVVSPSKVTKSDHRLLGDGRTWHPEGAFRPLPVSRGGAARVIAESDRERWERVHRSIERPNPFSGAVQRSLERDAILKFSWPKRVVICLQRQVRREVLGALGVLGRPGLRPPLMRPMSQIRC